MQTRSGSAALERADAEDVPSNLAQSLLKLAKEICQVMIGWLHGEVRTELKLVREDVNELRTHTKKVLITSQNVWTLLKKPCRPLLYQTR